MTNQTSQTSKIELLDPEDATGDTARYFEATREFLGRIPNSALALANTPYIARFYLPFNATLQREGMGGLLTCRTKEIVVLKTSFVNSCAYWIAHNTALGQATGITDAQIEAIASDDYMTSPVLNPRERAACLWAEHFTRNTARENPGVLEEVKKHFTDGEIVEMSLMSGKQGMMNRFMDSFGIPIEDEGEVNKIRKSVRGNPDKMKAYLQSLIDNWPEEFPEPNPDE